ncbi:MAG: tRNA (adenosine(37)-N6)-threonylcarbamoyltransferase complex ATPase subunit type 1 TsaE [Limnochordaceae bacterium]|nr:tRNA (adenosine(37)-N6)-threonylcarbamoyltransferase complex ATPase subunit type 1 TsaE [Limnochordaceae bacterium]
MRQLGARFAAWLREGDVVALYGSLGAGKTVFVRGVAQGLGVEQPVRSPTFTLLHIYPGPRLTMYHFDAYRLQSLAEWYALGTEEVVGNRGVSLIEWAERVESALPQDRFNVKVEGVGEASPRRVQITGEQRLAQWRVQLQDDPQARAWLPGSPDHGFPGHE